MGGIVDAGGEMADSVAQPDMPDAPENAGLDDPGHGPWWMQAPPEPMGSGGFPVVPDDPSSTGGFPVMTDDPHTGGFPAVTDEVLTSGGYPMPQEAFTSGGYPIVPDGSLTSGGYPTLPPGSHTSGGYPVMPSDRPSDMPSDRPSDRVGKKRSKAGVLGAGFVTGVGLLIVLVAGYLIFRPTGAGPAPAHKNRVVAAAAVAGGLNKTAALPAATAAYPFVMAGVRAAGADRPSNAVGVYSAPLVGPQELLFVGGAADTGDPAAFVHKIKPSTVLTTTNAAPGKSGGQAVCGTFQVLSDVHVYCAWATRGSFGVIATNMPTPIPDTTGMAALMAKMRGDLDKRF
jgi:hypothetical protein